MRRMEIAQNRISPIVGRGKEGAIKIFTYKQDLYYYKQNHKITVYNNEITI